MAYPPGSVFAGFTIERPLGTGGMGTVYLARHPRLPRRDALKLLRADLSADPGFRARFEREADLAARLDHRNIVTVYDRGRHDDQLWIDMQYVDGTDAAQALAADPGSMSPERVLRIVSEVGAGLDFAHRHGLWHRDVKPANILLAAGDDGDDERVLLTDFGVAKAVDEARQLTSTGNMLATLAYAAPEQIESRALDHRVDIYALGCVLYELLTNSVPYPEETAFATMAAHLNKPPPKVTAFRPDLPEAVDEVVARAMAKDRNDRFATCRELAAAARAAFPPSAEQPAPTSAPAPGADPGQGLLGTVGTSVGDPPAESAAPSAATPTREPTAPAAVPPRPPAYDGRTSGPRSDAPAYAGRSTGPGPRDTQSRPGPMPPGPAVPRPPFQIRVSRLSRDGAREELGPVYTDTLSLLETGALEDLLRRAGFFDLPADLPVEWHPAGEHRQEIMVVGANRTHTVGYDLTGSRRPPELDEFVSRLERIAQWRTISVPPRAAPTGAPRPEPAAAHPHPHTGGHPIGHHTGPPSPMPLTPPTGQHPVIPPTGGSGGRGSSRPWYRTPAALAGLAAALVVVLVVGIVLLTGGPDPLATPDDLEASAGQSQVELSWDDVAGAEEYRISRDDDVLDTIEDTSYVDDDVEPGSRYRYAVVALGADGAESEPQTRSVTVPEPGEAPPAPTDLVVSRTDGELTVSWTASADATSYTLFRGTVRVFEGAETSFVDTNVPEGQSEYSVLAVSDDGTQSERSAVVPVALLTTWGGLADAVSAFPNLLPRDPTENAPMDGVCGAGETALEPSAAEIVLCTYPNGVQVQVLHYTDTAALQAHVAEVAAASEDPGDWNYNNDDGSTTLGGTNYDTAYGTEPPRRFTTFVRDDRVLFALQIIWPNHSQADVVEWWRAAPF